MQDVVQYASKTNDNDEKGGESGHATLPLTSPCKVMEKSKLDSSNSHNLVADLSGSEEEVSEIESFVLEQEDLDDSEPVVDASQFLLPQTMEGADLRTVDPETQDRVEALLDAAGEKRLDGKVLVDPSVFKKLTSSVSCALDEATSALTRMRAEQAGQAVQDSRSLAEACSEGDFGAVRKLLDEGRNVPETTEEGDSLLSLACSAGYYELAQVLLAMRANVEDRGIKGDCTPLMEAASGGYLEIVNLLIAHGADVNAQSSAGNTPLHYAACGGYEDVVRALIKAGASVEVHNENGHTPLMEASSAGHVEVAKILLDSGAGINTHSNEFKESALTLACYKGHLEMVKFLLEAGADQEHKTDEMHTALMEASMDGHVEVARLLLDSGAQVNMPADSFESPLTLAACGGHVELASLLIERGANLEEVNDEGYTPLMEAAREGHEEMVALLAAHGANVNAQTEETQETALTLACCGGFLEVADFLIKSGADIELGCSTPLMEAAQEGHLDLVKYLIKSNANVHAQTGTGDTALTYACENGHTDVAEVLLDHGAKLEHESEGGRTPLMKSARAGHLCTVQFLITKGADVNRQTTSNDHTVLSLACAGGHQGVVELLLKHRSNPAHRLKDGSTMLIEAAKGGHTTVVNMLLDYPGVLPNPQVDPAAGLTQFAIGDEALRLPVNVNVQDLNNVVLPHDPNLAALPVSGTNFTPSVLQQNPGQVNLKDLNIPVRTPETILQNMQKSGNRHRLRLQQENENSKNLVLQSECDSNSRLEDEKSDSDEQSDLNASERLEQFINKMMKKTEQLNATPEEQILKKQQILEELQKVERELKEKAQAQLLRNAQNPSSQSRNNMLLQPPFLLEQGGDTRMDNLAMPDSSIDSGISADVDMKNKKNSKGLEKLERCQSVGSDECDNKNGPRSDGDGSEDNDEDEDEIDDDDDDEDDQDEDDEDDEEDDEDEDDEDEDDDDDDLDDENDDDLEGLMVAAPAMTLHETLLPSQASNPAPMVSMACSQHQVFDPILPTCAHHLPTLSQTSTITIQQTTVPPTAFNPQDINLSVPQTNFVNLTQVQQPGTFHFKGANLPLPHLNLVPQSQPYAGTVTLQHQAVNLPPGTVAPSYIPMPHALQQQQQQILQQQLQQIKLQQEQQTQTQPRRPLPVVNSTTTGTSSQQLLKKKNLKKKQAQHNTVCSNLDHPNAHNINTIGGNPAITTLPHTPTPVYPTIDVDAQTESNHDTALTLACAGGHSELVKLLLSRAADIEHRDKKGFTPLILAATAGHADVVELLLDHGADIEAQSERTKDTPLSLACSGGRYEVVQLLLARGACKEHRNVSDYTPLSLAASGGYVNIIKLLLSHGAEINSRTGSKLGISPLMLAAMNGHTAAVKLLLDMGSDINAQIETNRNTALTLACFQGRHEVVSLLVDRKANIEHRAKTGLTPLMEAASGGYVEVGRVLLDKGADVNAPPVPSSRDTALTIAADKGHYKFVELLLERGAAVDVKNKKGNSPLWLAGNGGHLDVVQLLIQYRADVDSQDNRKVSCLMAAFRKGHIKVIKFLVKYVRQFPSDQECQRYIATVTDKELLKKCHQCMDIIVHAKDRQAAEANKNAIILLEELDMEKTREESKKAALARKREKRKQKKKERQERDKEKEQGGKQSSPEPDEESPPPPPVEPEPIKQTVPIEPPSATTTTTIGKNIIADAEQSNKKSRGKRSLNNNNNNTIKVSEPNSVSSKNSKNSVTTSSATTSSSTSSTPNQNEGGSSRNKKNKGNKNRKNNNEKEKPPDTPMSVSMTITTSTTTTTVSSSSSSSATSVTSCHLKKPEIISSNDISDLDDFGTLPSSSVNVRISPKKEEKPPKNATSKKNKINAWDPIDALSPVSSVVSPGKPTSSPSGRLKGPSPMKGGHRQEEGWKEVVRKFKKVTVAGSAVKKVIGHGGSNINAIKEVTGAHIEVDKVKGSSDYTITIRGSADSTRQAHTLVSALIKDPDREINEILPKSKGKPVSAAPTNVFTNHVNGQASPVLNPSSQRNGSSNSAKSAPPVQLTTQTKPTNVGPRLAGSTPTIQAWSLPVTTSCSSLKRSKPCVSSVTTSMANMSVTAKSPGQVNRQLFPNEVPSSSSTGQQMNSKMSLTYQDSRQRMPSPPGTQSPVNSRQILQGTRRAPAPVGTKPDHQPLPIRAPMGHPQSAPSPPVSAPTEFSPFDNLFSNVAEQMLMKKDDRMNFASVAAAGVVTTTVTSQARMSPSPLPHSDFDPNLQAKAPGFKPGNQRTRSPSPQQQRNDIPQGYNVNVFNQPNMSQEYPHLGHPDVLQALHLNSGNMNNPILQAAMLSVANSHMMSGQNINTNAIMPDADFMRAPGFNRNMMSPRSNNSGAPSPRGMSGMPQGMPGMPGGMLDPMSLSALNAADKDQYTTRDQPMTLPKIASNLNPNAPDFTSRVSFGGSGFLEKSAFSGGQGPNVQSFMNQPPPRVPLHPNAAGGYQPGYHQNFPADFLNNPALIGGYNPTSSSGSQIPGPKPSQYSPLPPGAGRTTPSTGNSSQEMHSPNPNSSTDPQQSSNSPPSDSNDDRKHMWPIGSERVIGAERVQRKVPTPQNVGMGDGNFWMLGNVGDVNTDWLANSSPNPPTSTPSTAAEDRPHSAPVNASFYNLDPNLAEVALEQANAIGIVPSGPGGFTFNAQTIAGIYSNPSDGVGAGEQQNWNQQMWNNWSQQPPL